jgi:hypothetical protein
MSLPDGSYTEDQFAEVLRRDQAIKFATAAIRQSLVWLEPEVTNGQTRFRAAGRDLRRALNALETGKIEE